MSEPFSYSKTYILNKALYSETYDETVVVAPPMQAYMKAMILAVVGTTLILFTEVSPYIGWFIVTWSAVEALNVRFHKAWWLGRQLISKAANNELTLSIDDNGITIKSRYVDNKIAWSDISNLEKTQLGWLLYLKTGKSYISDSCLNNDAQTYLQQKAAG